MAVVHGNSTKLLFADADLTSYFRSSDWDTLAAVEDVTPFGAAGMARIYAKTINGGKLALAGWWDPTLLIGPDVELSAIQASTSPTPVTVAYQGLASGIGVDTMQVYFVDYKIMTPADKVSTISATFEGSAPVTIMALSLTDLTAKTTTGTGSGVDFTTVTTLNGGAAQLHVTAVGGTGSPSLVVKLQDSADNSTFADLAGTTFATVTTATTSQRINIASGTVRRYIRAAWTIAGTNPTFTFHVSFQRNV